MNISQIFQGFHFETPIDLHNAEAALWCDLPSVILITGPAGAGKTTLARRICFENQLQNPVCVQQMDRRGYQMLRRTGRPVILDNFKPLKSWNSIAAIELEAFLTDPTYPERKLGTQFTRKIGMMPTLIIITSNNEEIPADLFRRIDVVIGLAARPETFLEKKGGAK